MAFCEEKKVQTHYASDKKVKMKTVRSDHIFPKVPSR